MGFASEGNNKLTEDANDVTNKYSILQIYLKSYRKYCLD